MALDILNSTTLSEDITSETKQFTVASTANITVGNLLAIRGRAGLEMVKVTEIPVSGSVKVNRGVSGTRALAHSALVNIYIGAPDKFTTIAGSSPNQFIRLQGVPGAFPDYALPGTKVIDGAGNEYILVELAATAYAGTTVLISTSGLFTAAPLVGGDQGPVGLLVEPGTSDQYVWAQVYGQNSYAQESTASSGATSADIAVAATSVSTPDVGLVAYTVTSTSADRYRIYGMFIRGAATTATTSATSATGVAVPVFLNYPYVDGLRETITTS